MWSCSPRSQVKASSAPLQAVPSSKLPEEIGEQGALQTEESSLRKQLTPKSTHSGDRHYLQRCQIISAGDFSSGTG